MTTIGKRRRRLVRLDTQYAGRLSIRILLLIESQKLIQSLGKTGISAESPQSRQNRFIGAIKSSNSVILGLHLPPDRFKCCRQTAFKSHLLD